MKEHEITIGSISTGFKTLLALLAVVIPLTVSLITNSVTAGKYIQRLENNEKDFLQFKKETEEDLKEQAEDYKEDHETLIRVDENVKTIKQTLKDIADKM